MKDMKRQWRPLYDSANYRQHRFLNLSETPVMEKGMSLRKIFYDYFNRPASTQPSAPLPSVRTDLRSLYSEKPVIVWFGHSSYLLHCKGINILVDPVFNGHASPLPWMVKAFPGANVYSAADMPHIDILLITHNHYDHLDKHTLRQLLPNVGSCYAPLGVGRDIPCSRNDMPITEMDWWETQQPAEQVQLTATPARHFSGRGFKRGGSLWASYVLHLYGYTIYIGGDSGYDTHFSKIGEQYGPFDIAMLECGQYNPGWPYIHMFPEQALQAGKDLRAKAIMPVHWAKFTLANHPWTEPVERLEKAAEGSGIQLATPRIGEPVIIGEPYPQQPWWR
jgi:L-ascorbate metabolism protein UlaG (beta-lactamase superfamily)